jgi:hypothetical protein
MRKSSSLWVAIGVLLFLLVALVVFSVYMLQLVRQTTDQALSPVMGANAQLRTQVSGFLHPTPTIIPDPVTIINEVRSLARLETIQYSIEKVITAETGQGSFGFLFGDKLLFVAHGTVIAGIDLAQLTSQDLRLDGKVLTVQLPEPEIFVATLDNDKSYVYDRQKGLLNSGVTDLETKARQVAEQEIAEAAISDGILSEAKLNAENYLTRLFKTLGYQEVIFIYPTPEDVP